MGPCLRHTRVCSSRLIPIMLDSISRPCTRPLGMDMPNGTPSPARSCPQTLVCLPAPHLRRSLRHRVAALPALLPPVNDSHATNATNASLALTLASDTTRLGTTPFLPCTSALSVSKYLAGAIRLNVIVAVVARRIRLSLAAHHSLQPLRS